MAKGIALFALALLGLPIYGQQVGPLTDQRVIELARAGVRPDELARIIAAAPQVSFDLTPAWSQAMMTAGVTEDTIKAMAAREAGTAPSTAATQQSQGTEVLDKKPASEVAARGGPPQPTVSKLKDQKSTPSCTYFTVVTQDKLNNVKQGLSPDDVKWFQKSFAKKYPNVCYAEPGPTAAVIFYVTITPAVYHGTRIVNQTSTHSNPVSATVTEQDGTTSQVDGRVETTTTSSTAVPYSFEYGIFTLAVERRLSDGKFEVAQRFQQKGLYHMLYGIPLGGKGHHPLHAVVEDAAKWVSLGGLGDPRQSAF